MAHRRGRLQLSRKRGAELIGTFMLVSLVAPISAGVIGGYVSRWLQED